MTPANEYRDLAATLHVRARLEVIPLIKAECDYLAYCYELLADQAEKSRRGDIKYQPIFHS